MKTFSVLLFFSLVLSLHASSRFLQGSDPDCSATDDNGIKVNEGLRFIDPNDINRYRVCDNGVLLSLACSEGTYFNPANDGKDAQCVYANPSCKDENGNDVPHGNNIALASNPKGYLVCDNGVFKTMSCAEGTIFDAANAQTLPCAADPDYVAPGVSGGSVVVPTPVQVHSPMLDATAATPLGDGVYQLLVKEQNFVFRYQESVICSGDQVSHPFDCERFFSCAGSRVADWSKTSPNVCYGGLYPGSGWECNGQKENCPVNSCTSLNLKALPFTIESIHAVSLQSFEMTSLEEGTIVFGDWRGPFYYKEKMAYFFDCCLGTKLDRDSLTCV